MAQEVAKPGSAWIYTPARDLILGCGAWSLPLLVAGWALAANQAWVVLFYGLALFFNYPHYMATIYRAYHTKEDFARYRILTVHVTILLAATLVVAHGSRSLTLWLSTIYLSWSPWHYMGQNFGLAMMFIARSGVRMAHKDRNALWTAFVASYLIIFLSFHSNASTDPNFVSLGLPTLLDTLRIPLVAVFLILGIYPLSKLVRKAGFRPMLPAIVLYSTEFLWFVLPTIMELINSAHMPLQSYSAGILALMHSAQYLWITSYYAREEFPSGNRKWTWNGYLLLLILGGMALFIPGPWFAARFFRVDFTMSVLAFAAVVNIHHFILDGAIWKLRERRIASVLLRDKTHAAPTTLWLQNAGSRWRRPLAATATSLLIALAGLDQLRHYLATKNDTHNLTIAAELVPVDSAVQSRLARVLIQEQRYDEAYEHYRPIVEHTQPSIPTLLNFGMLCRLRGDSEKALETFERVLTLNPNSGPAHLQIADTLKSMGKPEEAAEHFERYRSLLPADPGPVSQR